MYRGPDSASKVTQFYACVPRTKGNNCEKSGAGDSPSHSSYEKLGDPRNGIQSFNINHAGFRFEGHPIFRMGYARPRGTLVFFQIGKVDFSTHLRPIPMGVGPLAPRHPWLSFAQLKYGKGYSISRDRISKKRGFECRQTLPRLTGRFEKKGRPRRVWERG